VSSASPSAMTGFGVGIPLRWFLVSGIRRRPIRSGGTMVVLALLALTTLGPLGPLGPAGAAPGTPDGASPQALCTPATGTDPIGGISGGYHAMTPTRVLDTRATTGPVEAGCTTVVDLVGLLTGQATGVALGLVAVEAAGPGYVTAFPCDAARPLASNLNTRTAVATPNAVTVPLGPSRRVCVFTSVRTQLVVDLTGWFGPGGAAFQGVTPTRMFDSRVAEGGTGPVPGGSVVRLPVAGTFGVPENAEGASVNLTVTEATAAGYVTAFPCDQPLPFASSGNYLAGETRATAGMFALDAAGDLCIFVLQTTELVVDLFGWFGGTSNTRYHPIVGTRVADSRDGTGGWDSAFPAGTERSFDPTLGGRVAVGENAVLDVIATEAVGAGYLTVYPCGTPRPDASSVNFAPGTDTPNLTTVRVGSNGRICVYAHQRTHVVVDVFGTFGPGGALRSLTVGLGDAPLTLHPAFSPDAHDYGVICPAASNALTVTADAVPGGTVDVVDDDGAGAITVAEDDLIRIDVARPGLPVESYFVRCLPSDFPPLTVDRPDDPAPGYYMITAGGQGGSTGAYVMILDQHGAVVWYKPVEKPALDFKVLPSGNVAWTYGLGVFNPTHGWAATFGQKTLAEGGYYGEYDLDGTLVRTWATDGAFTDHHDLWPQIDPVTKLPNGNMLMVAYHRRTGVDISALGITHENPANVWDAWIQEIDATTGDALWTWKSEDHIGVAESIPAENVFAFLDPATGGPGSIAPTPTTADVDLVHINSVDVDPDTGDLLISLRHTDAVYRIANPKTTSGDILWKLGGNAPTSPATKHLAIVGDPSGGPRRQHDARFHDGSVVLYDDQSPNLGAPCGPLARAVEYAVDPSAGPTGTATMVWQWENPDGACAAAQGGARKQADGSVVIAWGTMVGIPTINMTDVERWGNIALEVFVGGQGGGTGGSSYRVVKVPVSTFPIADLRAAAGGALSG
jgi:hypothetical protein